MTLYVLLVNAILFFICGYFIKSVVVFHAEKTKADVLQDRAQRGEYLPIVLQFDLNGMGGYTLAIFNMRGVHLVKENHDKFLLILFDFLESEKKRLDTKPKFELINFKKDE